MMNFHKPPAGFGTPANPQYKERDRLEQLRRAGKAILKMEGVETFTVFQ